MPPLGANMAIHEARHGLMRSGLRRGNVVAAMILASSQAVKSSHLPSLIGSSSLTSLLLAQLSLHLNPSCQGGNLQWTRGVSRYKKDVAPRNPDVRTRKNGARYGNRIRRTYPEAFLRMRSILGYYDMPHANHGEQQAVKQVTISMLQTQQYLASEPELRRRLLNYRVLAYNRELEGLHSQTCSYLNSLVKPTASAVPSLLRNRMAANK